MRLGLWRSLLVLLCLLGGMAPMPVGAQPSAGNALCTFQTTATAVGNGTACDITGYTLLSVQISGTVTGALLAPEGSVDGTNFQRLLCMDMPGLSFGITHFTAAGVNYCKITGYRSVRVRVAAAGASTSVSATGIALMGTFATNLP